MPGGGIRWAREGDSQSPRESGRRFSRGRSRLHRGRTDALPMKRSRIDRREVLKSLNADYIRTEAKGAFSMDPRSLYTMLAQGGRRDFIAVFIYTPQRSRRFPRVSESNVREQRHELARGSDGGSGTHQRRGQKSASRSLHRSQLSHADKPTLHPSRLHLSPEERESLLKIIHRRVDVLVPERAHREPGVLLRLGDVSHVDAIRVTDRRQIRRRRRSRMRMRALANASRPAAASQAIRYAANRSDMLYRYGADRRVRHVRGRRRRTTARRVARPTRDVSRHPSRHLEPRPRDGTVP